MEKKNLLFPLLLILLIFQLTNSSFGDYVAPATFPIYISNGSGLGIQDPPFHILISVISGNLNCSLASFSMHDGGGYFRFTSNETLTILMTQSAGISVKLAGDNDNELRVINNGTSYPIALNDRIQIIWDYGTNIWFPIEFIFGMVGLCSMFGSSILGVHMINKGEYVDGIKFAVVWFAFGIALTVAWLWA